jgi:hypothetical protein
METPSAQPIHNMEFPLTSRKKRWPRVDVETGDLILEEPHQQEHWVIKRNMLGQIIDLYRVDIEEEIRQGFPASFPITTSLFSYYYSLLLY